MSYGGGPPQPPPPGQDPYAMNYGGQPSYPSYPQQPTLAGLPSMPAYPPGPATGGYPPPSDAQPGQAPGYPPQPGMGGFPQAPHGYPQGYPAQPPAPGYPAQPPAPGYPAQAGAAGYPAQPPTSGYPAQPPTSGYPAQPPAPGYPAQGPASGYPAQAGTSGYPAQGPASGYPAQPPTSGYPAQGPTSGYPAQAAAPGYPAQPPASGYPAQGPTPGYSAQGPAPGYPAQPPGSGYPQAAPASGYPTQPPATGYPQAPPPTGGYGQPPPGQSVPGAAPYGATPMAPPAGTTTHGTLVPAHPFDSEADAQVLRAAMKGIGTDEKAIINVLSKRSNPQRIEIKTKFKVLFGKDLVRDLKSELSGNFEGCVVALFDPTIDYHCRCLRGAMKGVGTDEEALIEILTTSSNEQIDEIKARYKTLYSRNLENDLMSETSGHFKRLLVSLCQGAREMTTTVDMAKAEKEARDLHDAGEKRWGTDESRFNQVLALRSFPQLRATFEAYSKLASRDILNSIDREMSGDLKMGMKAVIKVVQCPTSFYAERLYRSMKGAGTDDEALIRIVVSRCEVDMVEIKNEFMKMYKKSLSTMIKGDTSGDYKRLLIALVGED